LAAAAAATAVTTAAATGSATAEEVVAMATVVRYAKDFPRTTDRLRRVRHHHRTFYRNHLFFYHR